MNNVLYFDQSGYEEAIRTYENSVELINEFSEMFEKKVGIPFTREFLKSVISGDADFKTEYFRNVDKKLKQLPDFHSLQDELRERSREDYDSLMDEAYQFRNIFLNRLSSKYGFYLDEIPIDDSGKANFKAKDAERIKSRYFVMRDDSELIKELKKLTEAHVKASADLNKFIRQNKNELGIYGSGGWNFFVVLKGYGGFLKYDEDGFINVNWGAFFKRKAYQDFNKQEKSLT